MIHVLAIGCGGFLGAVARYGVGALAVALLGRGLPFGTMIVNIVGSFLMGGLIEVFARVWSPGMMVQAFFITGFLGAFTTFSTFSLDAVTLYQRGEIMLAMGYVLLSVILSIMALFAGLYLARNIL